MKKILVTGGHVTPALAVMAQLKKQGWQITYVSRQYALEGDQAISEEVNLVKQLKYQFIPITTGRWQRSFTRYTILSLLKIPVGFIQAWLILNKLRPDIILSFGGYIAVPVCIVGFLLKIPVVIHEQTLQPGLANRLISKFAQKVCLGWPQAEKYFRKSQTVYTGNPLRTDILVIKNKLLIKIDKPLIYITGGNLGARTINQVIYQALPELVKDFVVIHQCGRADNQADFKKLTTGKKLLSSSLQPRYHVYPYINSNHIGWIFHQADLIIGRSGANIVTEIIALKKLAIFIPLPWSGNQEQKQHAQFIVARQAAKMVEQRFLTPSTLILTIKQAFHQRQQIIKNLQILSSELILNADKRVVDVVESVV